MRGSVKRSGSGWMIVVDLGSDPATGKRRQLRRRGFTTRRQAEDALSGVLDEVKSGTFVQPRKVSVTDYLHGWLSALEVEGRRQTTVASYRAKLDLYVIPRIGARELQSLTALDLDELYRDLLHAGGAIDPDTKERRALSHRTVRYVATILGKALGDAERKGLVQRNVARMASPPSARATKAKEPVVWTPEQTRAFLDFVQRNGSTHFPMLRLAAMTGMRRGELCGLRWSDVDLANATLTVRATITTAEHEVVSGDVKSERSRRVIDIDPQTVIVLRAHRKAQQEMRLMVGAAWKDLDLVFTMPSGEPWHPDVISRSFARLVARSDLPRIRLHDLRHGHATHLLAAGVNARLVAERLGHADVSFTLQVYGHVMPGQQAAAAAAVSALVDGAG